MAKNVTLVGGLLLALLLALAPALITTTGCTTDITDPGEDFVYVLGDIEPSLSADPRTSAVAAGDTLVVRVDSFGNTCRSKGRLRLDVDRDARRLTVSPFDRFLIFQRTCLDVLLTFEHADTIRLRPGSWTVVFRGSGIGRPHQRVITAEHTVEIPGAS